MAEPIKSKLSEYVVGCLEIVLGQEKKLYLFTLTLDTFGGQPCIVCRLTCAMLCHSPLGVCHDPRDTST